MSRSFVRSFARPFPARENNPFLRPPKREEGEGEEEEEVEDGFSRASRLLEWGNGRTIEPTNERTPKRDGLLRGVSHTYMFRATRWDNASLRNGNAVEGQDI